MSNEKKIEGKTAMSQLFDYLAENTNLTLDSGITSFFLKKEKDQIKEACSCDLKYHGWESAEIYFDENYPITNKQQPKSELKLSEKESELTRLREELAEQKKVSEGLAGIVEGMINTCDMDSTKFDSYNKILTEYNKTKQQ
jgi:hypothetical protein